MRHVAKFNRQKQKNNATNSIFTILIKSNTALKNVKKRKT